MSKKPKYSQGKLALDSDLDKNTVSSIIRSGRQGSWRTVATAERLRTSLGLKTLEDILVDSEVEAREDGIDKDLMVTKDKPTPAREYWHGAGSFQKQGDRWVEYPALSDGRHFEFQDMGVEGDYLYLVDEKRRRDDRSAMYVRIPITGGVAQWSFPNPLEWQDLYVVTPRTGSSSAETPTEKRKKKRS